MFDGFALMVHVGATCADANEVERANTAMLARMLIATIRALLDAYVFILKVALLSGNRFNPFEACYWDHTGF